MTTTAPPSLTAPRAPLSSPIPPPVLIPPHINAPTDVGKTHRPAHRPGTREKHPHGRGEDADDPRRADAGPETPPRTWGRQPSLRGIASCSGNTPTDVGKTAVLLFSFGLHQKHPHGRGEDQP